MENLIQDYQRLLNELGPVYKRKIYKNLQSEHRIVGIVGSRGVGKTTYILHYLKENYPDSQEVLYVSADDLYFAENTLVSLAEKFVNQYNGHLLCIDEIHKYPNWSQELKNIYDKYRNLKIIFSGSSSIDLIKEKYDLSRRAVLRFLPGLSFREFLEMKLNKTYPVLTIPEIISGKRADFDSILKTPRILGLFQEYLTVGYYPFFKEFKNQRDVLEALEGVIDKIIHMDIAAYYSLKTSTLPLFRKILYFIYTSKPSAININKIAKSLKKDHTDVSNYLEMMREAGLLRYLLIDKAGHALIRNAEKVYLSNTNLAYALENATGKKIEKGQIRELFFITSLENAGLKPFYSRSGDVKCGEYVFEIGGKGKDLSQIKDQKNAYIVADDILFRDIKKIQLYLFGFLY
jgi:predicted AAA+ superfamily ATPase